MKRNLLLKEIRKRGAVLYDMAGSMIFTKILKPVP